MKRKNIKLISLLVAVILIVGAAVTGTVAWLTAEATPVTNTFTTSDIGVNLVETKQDFKMVPGYDIAKDPKVNLTENSEAAWLFVVITESENFDTYMTYTVAEGWALVDGTTNVYAREVAATTTTAFSVLKDDKVTVLGSVTKDLMTAAQSSQPTLTFKAYASQLMKNANAKFTAKEAWANVSDPDKDYSADTTAPAA